MAWVRKEITKDEPFEITVQFLEYEKCELDNYDPEENRSNSFISLEMDSSFENISPKELKEIGEHLIKVSGDALTWIMEQEESK